MALSHGLYRLSPGSQIYPTFFNWDTETIGPYKLNLGLQYVGKDKDMPATYSMLMQPMLLHPYAVAVFDFNHVAYGIIEPGYFHTVLFDMQNSRLRTIAYDNIYVEGMNAWQNIGYIRTFLKCKAYTVYPYNMIQDRFTGMVPGFGEFNLDMAVIDPPPQIYRDLIKTDHAGVYIDRQSGDTKFLDYNPEFAHPYGWDKLSKDPLFDYYVKGAH